MVWIKLSELYKEAASCTVKCNGKTNDRQRPLLQWGTQWRFSGHIWVGKVGSKSRYRAQQFISHSYASRMSQNWRSDRGGGRAKNKQIKILQLIHIVKQSSYTKPHRSWMLLSFDRSNAAGKNKKQKNVCCGERGGVCACVCGVLSVAEQHLSSLWTSPTPPRHDIQSEISCESALV